jgi:hypothetical protein
MYFGHRGIYRGIGWANNVQTRDFKLEEEDAANLVCCRRPLVDYTASHLLQIC